VFFRAGATIPSLPNPDSPSPLLGGSQFLPEALRLITFVAGCPNSDTTSSLLFEDDGKTLAYQEGAFSTTNFTTSCSSNMLTSTISAYQGTYQGMPTQRGYELSFMGAWPAETVTVNGNAVSLNPECSLGCKCDCWFWDGSSLSLNVVLGSGYPTNAPINTKITFANPLSAPELTTGIQRQQKMAQQAKDILDDLWGTYYPESDYPTLCIAANALVNLTDLAEVPDRLQDWPRLYSQALLEVEALTPTPYKTQALSILQIDSW